MASFTPRNERIVWVLIYIIIFATSFVAMGELKKELTHTKQELLIAQQQLVRDTTSLNKNPIMSDEDTFTDNTGAIFTPINGELLKADLLSHPELIPYSGVLGGTMNFYNEDMTIVGNKWIISYFEDGHIWWYSLYTYTGDENNISWILLDSYIL